MATHQHTASPTTNPPSNYITGLCAAGRRDRCLGAYAGTTCACPHHTAPPPDPVQVVTIRCVFGCRAAYDSTSPWEAHEAMEGHYRDAHADDITTALVGGGS